MELAFSGEVWFWRGPSPFHFVTVPEEEAAAIEHVADLATYVVTSVQLGLAHPDTSGGVIASIGEFLGIFALTQIPLAIAEGLLGVLVFRLLTRIAPDELRSLGLRKALDETPVSATTEERG